VRGTPSRLEPRVGRIGRPGSIAIARCFYDTGSAASLGDEIDCKLAVGYVVSWFGGIASTILTAVGLEILQMSQTIVQRAAGAILPERADVAGADCFCAGHLLYTPVVVRSVDKEYDRVGMGEAYARHCSGHRRVHH